MNCILGSEGLLLNSDFEEEMVESVSDSLNIDSLRFKGFGVKASCRLFSFGGCLFTGSEIRDLGSRKMDAMLPHEPKEVMIETSSHASRLIPTL